MGDLHAYRNSVTEQARIADLMSLIPPEVESVIDIGARDGYLSRKLLERIPEVTALDLQQPTIDEPRIRCVQGNAAALDFSDGAFDLVFCTEVLEHIPRPTLEAVCSELARVAKHYVLIGVPYRQDTRVGRTTCQSCGKPNPPWGHVNQFDERTLQDLFPTMEMVKSSFVGTSDHGTNAVACWLMDYAGNPYGAYSQEESCIHCGGAIGQPRPRSLLQKVVTKLAVLAQEVQKPFVSLHGNWIHLLFRKKVSGTS